MISEYIKIEETVIPVSGITQKVTLMHVTDMHLTLADERDDINTCRIAKGRTCSFSVFPGISIAEVFKAILATADASGADCTVMSGDILDFPSQANLEALDRILNKSGREYLYITGIPDSLQHNRPAVVDSPKANETTRAFCRYVTGEAGDNLYGVFTGHVHFNHMDSYRIDRFQYVTAPGFSGACRKITLVPEI